MKHRIAIDGFMKRLNEAVFASDLEVWQICERTGIKRSNLADYRYHGVIPNAGNLLKVCLALNTSADYLLGIKSNIESQIREKTIDECINALGNDYWNIAKLERLKKEIKR